MRSRPYTNEGQPGMAALRHFKIWVPELELSDGHHHVRDASSNKHLDPCASVLSSHDNLYGSLCNIGGSSDLHCHPNCDSPCGSGRIRVFDRGVRPCARPAMQPW